MKNSLEISLSMPLYNEESCVRKTVKDLSNEFKKNKVNYELILVNNGSNDSTPEIIDQLHKENPDRIKTLHLKKNIGYGGGILAGMKKGKGYYVGFTCGDGQISPKDTIRVFRFTKNEDLDFCKTIRVCRKDGIFREVISFFYNFMTFLFFLSFFNDVNGYPVIMKRSVFKKLKIRSKNYIMNLEILLKTKRNKLRVGNVPITFHERFKGKGHVKTYTLFEFFKQLITFKLSWSKYIYVY
jgi:glycosyltransferase involved in cell wall biosynthesis